MLDEDERDRRRVMFLDILRRAWPDDLHDELLGVIPFLDPSHPVREELDVIRYRFIEGTLSAEDAIDAAVCLGGKADEAIGTFLQRINARRRLPPRDR